MADNETVDLANQLGRIFGDVAGNATKFGAALKEANRDIIDLGQVFEHLARNSKDLPKNILEGKDLQKEILKDAKLFKKVQKDSLELGRKLISDYYDEAVKKLKEQNGSYDDLIDLTIERSKLEAQLPKDLERQFKILKRQGKEAKTQFENINTVVNTLGKNIRDPGSAVEGFLGSLGELPQKLAVAKDHGDSTGDALKSAFETSKIGQFAKMIGKGGPVVLGLVAVTAALTVLWKLFRNYWDFLDKNVMPAQAEFNKQIGGTTEASAQLKQQSMAMGVQFELLGKSFAEGAQAVRELAIGMKSVELDKETLKTGTELTQILGLSGKEAGKLALQFTKQGASMKDLNDMMTVASNEVRAYGLVQNDVLQDMARSPEILARFGVANRMEFAKSTAKAQSYGLSIKEVNAAFGKQMDTFEGTADSAAKLNAIFGTNINSMELMMETNPQKRMEMLRRELENQGKSWEKLSVFEKNVITQQLGVDESQAALILSSEEERKKLEAKAAAKRKEIRVNEEWNKGINSIKSTLIAWGKELDRVMRAVSELITTMFGVDDPTTLIKKGIKGVVKTIRDLTLYLKDATAWWEEFHNSGSKLKKLLILLGKYTVNFLGTLSQMLGMDKVSEFFADLSYSLDRFMKMDVTATIKKTFKNIFKWIKDNWMDVAKAIINPLGTLGEKLLGSGEKGSKGLFSKFFDDATVDASGNFQPVAAGISSKGEVVKFAPGDRVVKNPGKMGGGEQTTNINLYLDGEQIASVLVKGARVGA